LQFGLICFFIHVTTEHQLLLKLATLIPKLQTRNAPAQAAGGKKAKGKKGR
jgi:hypothetical protein